MTILDQKIDRSKQRLVYQYLEKLNPLGDNRKDMSIIFAGRIEKEQDKRLADEFAKILVELIEKKHLKYDDAKPLLNRIFVTYSKKEPELTQQIFRRLDEIYSKTK